MPYHVFARAGGLYPFGDCDLETEEEVLKNYCIPYCDGKPITIAGAVLERKDISGLVIFLSDLSSFELVKEAPDNIQRMRGRGREYEAIRKSASATDISGETMRKASNLLGGNIKSSESQPSSIDFSGSTFFNAQVAGVMNQSTMNITVNKPEIEGWLQQITAELEKNSVQNEELRSAIETLNAALQTPKPSGAIIKVAVEAVKSIGFNLVSSKIWEYLMTHPPI